MAYGSPEEMIDRLGEFRDRMGVTGFLLDLNFGGQIPQELELNSMRLLTEKVMPAFKGALQHIPARQRSAPPALRTQRRYW